MAGGEHRTDFVSTYPFNALLKEFSYIEGHPSTKGDIIIGNDVWIAGGAKIMSGVKIGDGAVIGANALVTKDIPDYAIAGGVPARVIKYRFSRKDIKALKEMKWWDWADKDIINTVELLQSDNIKALTEYYKSTVKG